MKRKTILILALLLIFTFLASSCGTTADQSKEAAKTATTTTKATESTAPAKEAAKATVTPKGQFPIVPADQPPVTLSVVITGDKPLDADNYAVNELEKKANVKLNITAIPLADAGTKLNLMLTSGDYPDIFQSGRNAGDPLTFTTNRIEQYGAKEKILLPLNDYIEKYGVEINKLLSLRPEYKLKVSGSDGKVYGFPNAWECYHCTAYGKVWIDTGWLDKLGLKMPQTTDELEKVLIAFRDNDPNGNGKKDEIPFTGSITSVGVENWFLNSFLPVGASTNAPNLPNYLFADSNNKLVFSAVQPEYREGLKYIKKLVDQGLVDKASFTQKSDQMAQLVRQDPNIVGSYEAYHFGMGIDNSKPDRCKAIDVLPPVAGPKGIRYQGRIDYIDVTGFAGMVITNKCKYPEVAFRYGDMQYEEDWGMIKQTGKPDVAWGRTKPGTKSVGGKEAKYWWNSTMDPKIAAEAKRHQFPVGPVNRVADLWDASLPMPEDIYSTNAYEARLSLLTDKVVQYFYPGYVPSSFYMGADSEEFLDIQNNIINTVKTSTVQFILGQKSIDKDWDSFVNELKGLRLDRYMQIYQKKFDEYVKIKK